MPDWHEYCYKLNNTSYPGSEMSVTIVTSLPAPTQNTISGSADNSVAVANVPDFLSLLIGQLAPVALESGAEVEIASDQPVPDDLMTNTDALIAALGMASSIEVSRGNTSPPDEDTGREDAGLASVSAHVTTGTAPSIQISHSDTSTSQGVTGKIDTALAPTLAPAAHTMDNTGKNFALNDTAAPDATSQNGRLGNSSLDDKAAKFAVSTSTAPVVERILTKTSSVDTSPNNASALGNVNTNLNIIHRQNDASLSVQTPVRDQNWASDFSQKIVWLASNDKQSAQITLNPAQMGPIEISLNVDKGNATASFVSVNADVREAIESALPRLREMFASAGIELGQTNVSAESFKQQADSESRGTARAGTDNAILAAESTGTVSVSAFATQRGNGMVDLFA